MRQKCFVDRKEEIKKIEKERKQQKCEKEGQRTSKNEKISGNKDGHEDKKARQRKFQAMKSHYQSTAKDRKKELIRKIR